MALSGTIKAQGLMVILCPELSDWANYKDPEQNNRISYGYQDKVKQSLFIQHLVSCFRADNGVAILSADNFSGEAYFVAESKVHTQFNEQERAINSICKVAQGRRNRPLVLTADRGRGKSSALGIAAAQLMKSAPKTIILSAPHIHNVEQVFLHVQSLLPDAQTAKNTLTYQSSSLSFKPLDILLQDHHTADLLLIDEASAIPVHVLSRLAVSFPRAVFSATAHGYEGSGRGFEMRFIKQLAQLKPEFKRLQLQQPIRWYQQDRLEQFWFNSMFQNEQHQIDSNDSVSQTISCKQVTKRQLLDDKTLLSNLFRLLIEAHYQTSQDDLQRLLDAPEIHCFILTKGSTVLGVAQIIEEGGDCIANLAQSISDCTRRVKGHLVAQNIASSYNEPQFVSAPQWRISRIAIAPEHQRLGLGKNLLEFVEQNAIQQKIQYLTTSFGCNTDILKFWTRSDFLLTKLSAKPEVSSGEHSCICIKSLATEALLKAQAIHLELHQEILYQMSKTFRYLDEELLLQIILLRPQSIMNAFTYSEIIEQFAIGQRPYSGCKRYLQEYLLAHPAWLSRLVIVEQCFIVAALFQNHEDKRLRERFNLEGKKQIEQRLKTNFKQILTIQPVN